MEDLIKTLRNTRDIATKSLINPQHRSKWYYDPKVKCYPYSVADAVYVLKEHRDNKLDRTYKSNYRIAEILDKYNVILEDRTGTRYLKHMDKIKPAYDRRREHVSDEYHEDPSSDIDTDDAWDIRR